jgi:hypothetical protein
MATTLPDTIAPSVAPVITVEFIRSTYVSLQDAPRRTTVRTCFTRCGFGGQPYASTGRTGPLRSNSSVSETTHIFAVLASDFGNNLTVFDLVAGTRLETKADPPHWMPSWIFDSREVRLQTNDDPPCHNVLAPRHPSSSRLAEVESSKVREGCDGVEPRRWASAPRV